jgi:hypothetical protein
MTKKLRKYGLEAATVSVVIICLIVEMAWAIYLHAFEWSLQTDTLPLLRLSAFLAVSLATFWTLRAASRNFIIAANTSWWDPSDRPESTNLDWYEVYKLVAFDRALDPISVPVRARWRWWFRSLFAQVPLYLLIWGIYLSVVDLIRDPSPRSYFLGINSPGISQTLVAALSNPTAYLALIVGLATIFFTFRQIRAKVRADSRQQWIIQARKLLGEVISMIDTHRDLRSANRFKESEEVWNRLNPSRLELELMLNPSEKDHRLLLYLIQRFAMWRHPEQQTQDAKILKSSVEEASGELAANASQFNEKLLRIIETTDRAELVSYILRLAHVVLKREWERVKHTR